MKVFDQAGESADWKKLTQEVESLAGAEELPTLTEIIQNYRKRFPNALPSDVRTFFNESFDKLSKRYETVERVRRQASQNQSTYLTWDHMDIYFATSMRKAWEYEDLYDFIQRLLSTSELKQDNLIDHIRYFDPTQSFTDNRVNKGLAEALMLKRARCTVYSVQDTDTLGKDSELASTLAQGKPVIAYVPDLDIEARVDQLVSEDPRTILERLRFVLYADESLAQNLNEHEYKLVEEIQDQLEQFVADQIWSSMPDTATADNLKTGLGTKLREFCDIVARSEKAVYDKRAKTLRESHPLAIQVNLETGVANGVLVVRSIPDCAALLRRILLYSMEFDLEEESRVGYSDKDSMWNLRERISGCIFRVVTNDRKLSNCFWNFYLR
jgi:hypothetical protein